MKSQKAMIGWIANVVLMIALILSFGVAGIYYFGGRSVAFTLPDLEVSSLGARVGLLISVIAALVQFTLLSSFASSSGRARTQIQHASLLIASAAVAYVLLGQKHGSIIGTTARPWFLVPTAVSCVGLGIVMLLRRPSVPSSGWLRRIASSGMIGLGVYLSLEAISADVLYV